MLDFLNQSNEFSFTPFLNQNFLFYEFDLKELGLPPADEILKSVVEIQSEIGMLQSWKKNNSLSGFYKGFSLTYNESFKYPDQSIYGQTFGDYQMTQSFSRNKETSDLSDIKNSYYDTLAFKQITKLVNSKLSFLINRFNFDLSRSRCAYMYGGKDTLHEKINYHVDEFPCQLLRLNIPLKTSEEYLLDINGKDEFGNELKLVQHLKVGKAYVWNTRIPHKVFTKTVDVKEKERIHLVLGLVPWLKYSNCYEYMYKNDFWGVELKKIIEDKYFIKDY